MSVPATATEQGPPRCLKANPSTTRHAMLLACNIQRIWPATEVTLSFPGRLLSGRTGGQALVSIRFVSTFFSAGEHSGTLLNGAGFRHIRANHTITFRGPCAHGYSTGGMILNGKI